MTQNHKDNGCPSCQEFKSAYEHACRDAALCLGMSPEHAPKSLNQAIGLIRGDQHLPQKQAIYATFARYFDRAMGGISNGRI